MMSPLPFPPAYSQETIRNTSTEYPLTTEYLFTSESTRDLFYHSRKQLPSLEHPNILRVKAVETANEGKLFKVSVHSEDVEWTLQRTCLRKWRLGEEWSSTDVKVLVEDVLSALQFVSERGFAAADLQWSNIAVTNGGYKLMALSQKSSDAVSESAGLETKGQDHIQLQSTEAKDTEKEAIYALGLLSLFLLSPENQGLATVTDPCPHVEALTISEDLKQLLVAMLHPDPSQRPTAEQLRTLCMQPTKLSPARLLSTLCGAIDSKKWEEVKTGLSELFAQGEVSATLTFPCSACKTPISLQPVPIGTVEVCPRHLVCKVACLLAIHEKHGGSVDCPCCARERVVPMRQIRIVRRVAPREVQPRECAACSKSFYPDDTEKWRLDYTGSPEYSQSETVCSLQCMRRLSEQTLAVPESEADDWLIPVREENDRWNSLLKCFHELVTSSARDPLRMQEIQLQLDSFLAIIQENILTNTSGFACHLCLSELSSRLLEGRWLLCGTSYIFVCSQDCFARHLQVDVLARKHVNHACPTCGNRIRSVDLTKTLDSYLDICGSCSDLGSIQLPCNHFQCGSCCQRGLKCEGCLRLHRGTRFFGFGPMG